MKQRWNRWRRGRWSQGGGVKITHRRTRGWGRKSRGSNERELHQRGHERPREKLRVDRSWLPVPRDISLSFGRHQTCKYCTHKSCKHFRRMTHYLELGWNWDIKHNSLCSCVSVSVVGVYLCLSEFCCSYVRVVCSSLIRYHSHNKPQINPLKFFRLKNMSLMTDMRAAQLVSASK